MTMATTELTSIQAARSSAGPNRFSEETAKWLDSANSRRTLSAGLVASDSGGCEGIRNKRSWPWKICEKFEIPVPSRGYWAKRVTGVRVENTPLLPHQSRLPLKIQIKTSAVNWPRA